MAKAPKDKDMPSPKRGAFPVPKDVLARAEQYHPRERATDASRGAPETSTPDEGAGLRAPNRPKREEENEGR